MINMGIQIQNRMSYMMLGVQDPVGFNGMWVWMNPMPLAPTQASIEIQILHL